MMIAKFVVLHSKDFSWVISYIIFPTDDGAPITTGDERCVIGVFKMNVGLKSWKSAF